jgi:hypothetical protein
MFLAKLLVGSATDLGKDSTLVIPPYVDPIQGGRRYNTVRGSTGGSPVFVVYENGRAYPSYLVRYYKGERDPLRTKYATFDEATAAAAKEAADTAADTSGDDFEDGDDAGGADPSSTEVTWQFMVDGGGWMDYLDDHQELLEAAYRNAVAAGAAARGFVVLDTPSWTYEVDLASMSQVNCNHPSHTRRQVRRWVVTDVEV